MDIISSLKSKIGSQEIDKLSAYLGESPSNVHNALSISLNYILASLIKLADNRGDASSILKVISDGGHSGDINDDLNGLFGNGSKLQLLIAIGRNINSHFFAPKLESYINQISSKSGVTNSSASSILSLSAPMVLGACGRIQKTENLNQNTFYTRLKRSEELLVSELDNDDKVILGYSMAARTSPVESTPIAPPPHVAATGVSYADEPSASSVPPRGSRTKKASDGGLKLGWPAWVILGLLGIGALLFSLKDKLPIGKISWFNTDKIAVSDSTAYNEEGDLFDELGGDEDISNSTGSTLEELPSSSPSATDGSDLIAASESSKKTFSEKTEPANNTSDANSGFVNSDKANNTDSKKATGNSEPSTKSTANYEPTGKKDTRPMGDKLALVKDYFGVNNLNYQKNSAEILEIGAVKDLADFLKANPSKTLEIAGTSSNTTLSEDRAYALRERLYREGIDVKRVSVNSTPVKNTGDQVVVKIK